MLYVYIPSVHFVSVLRIRAQKGTHSGRSYWTLCMVHLLDGLKAR